MIQTTLEPLAQSDEQPRERRATEDAGYLQSGTLELTIGKKKFNLQAGDSFSIVGVEIFKIGKKVGGVFFTLLLVIHYCLIS